MASHRTLINPPTSHDSSFTAGHTTVEGDGSGLNLMFPDGICKFESAVMDTRSDHMAGYLDSYTIRGIDIVVKVWDSVLMRPSGELTSPYIARVESIRQYPRGSPKVKVRLYYKPEEAAGGRRVFHGMKELFLSDRHVVRSAHKIEKLCKVHSMREYTRLEDVGTEDYYCRFGYEVSTATFSPDRTAVYCICSMPYNPDSLMLACEECKDWFHPACLNMTVDEAKKLERFKCPLCSSDNDI